MPIFSEHYLSTALTPISGHLKVTHSFCGYLVE